MSKNRVMAARRTITMDLLDELAQQIPQSQWDALKSCEEAIDIMPLTKTEKKKAKKITALDTRKMARDLLEKEAKFLGVTEQTLIDIIAAKIRLEKAEAEVARCDAVELEAKELLAKCERRLAELQEREREQDTES